MGRETTTISLKQETINLPNVKVVDAKGNPIDVSAIVRYRIYDISLKKI